MLEKGNKKSRRLWNGNKKRIKGFNIFTITSCTILSLDAPITKKHEWIVAMLKKQAKKVENHSADFPNSLNVLVSFIHPPFVYKVQVFPIFFP